MADTQKKKKSSYSAQGFLFAAAEAGRGGLLSTYFWGHAPPAGSEVWSCQAWVQKLVPTTSQPHLCRAFLPASISLSLALCLSFLSLTLSTPLCLSLFLSLSLSLCMSPSLPSCLSLSKSWHPCIQRDSFLPHGWCWAPLDAMPSTLQKFTNAPVLASSSLLSRGITVCEQTPQIKASRAPRERARAFAEHMSAVQMKLSLIVPTPRPRGCPEQSG